VLLIYSQTFRFSTGKRCPINSLKVLHRPVELAPLIRWDEKAGLRGMRSGNTTY
jgi:hypothetical protein